MRKKKKKFWVFSMATRMTWGKYAGHYVRQILDFDPDYIIWCATNIWGISIKIKPDVDAFFKKTYGQTLSAMRETASKKIK